MVFGVMTAVLAAGLVATSAIAQTAGEPLPLAESGVVLMIGTSFVLLGWGVLKQVRLCAATAGILAGAILILEVSFRFLGYQVRGSTYLLVMPVFVLVCNGLAWLEMTRVRPKDGGLGSQGR